MQRTLQVWLALCTLGVSLAQAPSPVHASSHREAPFITESPKVDGTDFYMFRSYEAGRADYVTVIANYQPFQPSYGGPNFFTMDPDARYEIHLDNDGDAVEDLTFRFRFDNQLAAQGSGIAVSAGGKVTPVPLASVGPISVNDVSNLNVQETYRLQVVRGARRRGNAEDVVRVGDDANVFRKPTDYIGSKTFGPPGDYEKYARAHVYDVRIPGCPLPARVFAGQRKESFSVNLGAIFDLVNAPASVVAGGVDRASRSLVPSSLADDNITTLALELPVQCIQGKGTVVGGWTSSSLRQVRVLNPRARYELPAFEGGAYVQVSRLGMPLVNEVVVGLPDKDRFNGSQPRDDGQFAQYVTHPSLPEILEVLFGSAGVQAPNRFPRSDLVAAFLTGVPSVNANGSTAEMIRLNTALPPTPKGSQNSLGAAGCFNQGVLALSNAGCDPAGFPNGRRPGDDVVDVSLRVAMGYLLPLADAPSGQLAFTDAALQEDAQFDAVFPYLTTPIPGAL